MTTTGAWAAPISPRQGWSATSRSGRRCAPVAARHGTWVEAVAVAWVLSFEAVTGAIVGARSPAQVEGWLPAADLVLTAADLDEIASAVELTGAGSGPGRPRPADPLGKRLAQHRLVDGHGLAGGPAPGEAGGRTPAPAGAAPRPRPGR